jgi:hypothetical protein
MPTTFTLIVEGRSKDPLIVAEHALELDHLVWHGDDPPDVVILESGTTLMKVGRYASPGEQWRYRIAVVAHLSKGRLVPCEPRTRT